MPHKAFLKKKSLLDRFKDDHERTGYIQSARAKHTWNNPLTRRKRTKELNGWIKSFAGKNHIRKLSRFNAQQAGKNESAEYNVDCLRYGSTLELPNGVCVKVKETIRCPRRAAFIFRVQAIVNGEDGFVIHGFYPVYGLERRLSEEFDLHSDDATALVSFIENNVFNSRGESTQHKLTIKLHETKFDPSQYDFFKASYTLDGTNRVKNTNGIVDAQGTLEMAQRHGATNLNLVGVKDGTETDIPLSDVGISESKDEAMSLKGFLETLEEKLVKQFDLDEEEVKNYLDTHTQEMQELLDDKELSLKEKVLFVRSEITGEKDEAKEPTEEKLGYEKGHKNSKGENAPWVIRSHEDNRILASFAKKTDAEEHLQRMKQYSKQESMSADELDKYIKDVKSLLKSKYGMDFNDKDTCRLNVGWLEKLDAMFYQGKPVEDGAKEVAAFCGYNKNESKQSEANGTFDAPIKDWYMGAYKEDDLGDRLNGTFKGALQTLMRGDDIYDYIGVGDSLIRERLFSKLAEMLDVDYDEIYNVWLNEGAASNELTAKLNKIGIKRTRTIPPTIKDKVNRLGRGVLPPKIVKVTGESKKSERLFNKAELERYAKEQGMTNERAIPVAKDLKQKISDGITQCLNAIKEAGAVANPITVASNGERPAISTRDTFAYAPSYVYRESGMERNYVGVMFHVEKGDDYGQLFIGWDKKNNRPFVWAGGATFDSYDAFCNDFKRDFSECFKKSEANNLAGYTSDVISELVESFHYGEDGATKLADKYSDTINDAYVEGESLPYETARFIARQDGNGYANESKKSESKKSEVRLELIDTIVVPKWLWEAYNFGNEYGEDLDEHEQNILSEFKETYADCHLDDEDEESYFSSYNDFDSYGGQCYTVKVYKEQ